jgi:hypothetical protein
MTTPLGSSALLLRRNLGVTGGPIAAPALLPAIPPSDHDERPRFSCAGGDDDRGDPGQAPSGRVQRGPPPGVDAGTHGDVRPRPPPPDLRYPARDTTPPIRRSRAHSRWSDIGSCRVSYCCYAPVIVRRRHLNKNRPVPSIGDEMVQVRLGRGQNDSDPFFNRHRRTSLVGYLLSRGHGLPEVRRAA